MVLGLSLSAFTTLHVIISLIGIGAGFVVAVRMLGGLRPGLWDAVFLSMTVLTSVTGFFFPFVAVGPPHIIGALSLVLLAIAIAALYRFGAAGAWAWIYVVTALLAQYFNVFVGIVQAFQKIPPLRHLAPTQSEGPFLGAQLAVLAIFIVWGALAVRRYHPNRPSPA